MGDAWSDINVEIPNVFSVRLPSILVRNVLDRWWSAVYISAEPRSLTMEWIDR